jgi:hypothetical protein
MPTVRYRVDDVPPQWADAFMPMPTLSPAGSTSVSWTISAAWGTEEVPVSSNHKASGTRSTSPDWKDGSAVAPDYFCPDVAVQDITRLGPPVQYLPLPFAMLVDPVEPIGTLGPLGPSAVVMRGRKVGGRRSMHWPRVVPFWPGLNGGSSS